MIDGDRREDDALFHDVFESAHGFSHGWISAGRDFSFGKTRGIGMNGDIPIIL
jgi:hypothetical protein